MSAKDRATDRQREMAHEIAEHFLQYCKHAEIEETEEAVIEFISDYLLSFIVIFDIPYCADRKPASTEN